MAILVGQLRRRAQAGARQALETYWRRVSDLARFSQLRRSPLDILLGRWTLDKFSANHGIDGHDVQVVFAL